MTQLYAGVACITVIPLLTGHPRSSGGVPFHSKSVIDAHLHRNGYCHMWSRGAFPCVFGCILIQRQFFLGSKKVLRRKTETSPEVRDHSQPHLVRVLSSAALRIVKKLNSTFLWSPAFLSEWRRYPVICQDPFSRCQSSQPSRKSPTAAKTTDSTWGIRKASPAAGMDTYSPAVI